MKPLIIIHTPSRDLSSRVLGYPTRDVFGASIVVVKNLTHFKCVKHRWENVNTDNELIPIYLLREYLKHQVIRHLPINDVANVFIDNILDDHNVLYASRNA